MYENTISRCVKNKYYQYQDQIYPFNTLMPSGNVQGKSHDEIYQILSSILKTEDKDNPYQDQILIEMLEKEGVKLSRRGLANLRKKWNIPNSYQRKQRY